LAVAVALGLQRPLAGSAPRGGVPVWREELEALLELSWPGETM